MTRRKRKGQQQVTIIRLPPTPPGTRRLASVPEACVYAHLSRAQLYRFIQQKRIKAYKLKRRVLVDLDTIDKLMNSLPALDLSHAHG